MADETKGNIERHWDKDSSNYQSSRNVAYEDIHYGPLAPSEEELNLLGDVSGKEVIEMGCGGAEISIALSKMGAKCTAVDISEEQLEYAREKSEEEEVKIEFYKDDIEKLESIENESKDLAVSSFAFDWAQDIDSVFEAAYRALKPGGVLVFSTQHPFYNCFTEPDEEFELDKSYYKEEEKEGDITFQLRKIEDFVNGLIDQGFKIEKLLEPEPVEGREDRFTSKYYPKERLEMIPATIIVKAIKEE